MNDTFYELTITCNEAYTDLISDFVANIYGDAVEISKGKIIVRSETPVDAIQSRVEELAASCGDAVALSCSVTTQANNDWMEQYRNSVQPIEAGPFYVHPSWHLPKEGCINITVDPALAFGSGHHETTYSCLEAIGAYTDSSKTLLDVGCGSGILALAARKKGTKVWLCDTDPVSVESSQSNFALNDETFEAAWEGSVNKTDAAYDIVVANIIADVIRAIAPSLRRAVAPDGLIILSGILDKKESIVTPLFDDFTLIERKPKGEWITLVYKRAS